MIVVTDLIDEPCVSIRSFKQVQCQAAFDCCGGFTITPTKRGFTKYRAVLLEQNSHDSLIVSNADKYRSPGKSITIDLTNTAKSLSTSGSQNGPTSHGQFRLYKTSDHGTRNAMLTYLSQSTQIRVACCVRSPVIFNDEPRPVKPLISGRNHEYVRCCPSSDRLFTRGR